MTLLSASGSPLSSSKVASPVGEDVLSSVDGLVPSSFLRKREKNGKRRLRLGLGGEEGGSWDQVVKRLNE